jgi:hypothetical protein
MGRRPDFPLTEADLRAYQGLKGPRRYILGAEIVLTYGRVRWLMSRKSRLPGVVEKLRRTRLRMSRRGAQPRVVALRMGHAVSRTLPMLPTDSRCLMRSLVLTSVLARRGVPSRVVIGVQAGDEFGAHAWVEHEGEPVLPTSQDEYARLLEV